MTIYLASDTGLTARCETPEAARALFIRIRALKTVNVEDYWQQRSESRRVGKSRARRAFARAYSKRLARASQGNTR